MNAPEAYPLRRDATEHARLEAQARFWSAEAAALFELGGIAAGWQVADLGCGTLAVAELLAQRVGPHGGVRALDNDPVLVRRMAHLAASLPTVRVEECDACATGWASASLDAAHARFLAAPAGRLDPLVAEMTRLVRPGGVVLLQEPDADSWSLPHAGDAWRELRALIRAGFAIRGGDFDAGRQLVPALERARVVGIEERRVVRLLPSAHPYAALPLAFARQLRDLWLRERLVTTDALDRMLAAIRDALARDGRGATFTLVQAWGRVRPSS